MRNSQQPFTLRGYLFLVFALAATTITVADPLNPPAALKPGEAFVIVKVTGDVKSLSFQQFQGTETFEANRDTRGILVRVRPGRYYLKNVTPVHMGIRLPSNPEPAEPSQTVAIREGVVNYIGDWRFMEEPGATDIRYDFQTSFDLETVRSVAAFNKLEKYGLMVSKVGELPTKTPMPN